VPTYVQLRRRADRLYHEADCLGALRIYLRLLEAHAKDHAVCLHVGDALARLGLRRRAAQVYASVALDHLRAGRPLQGVSATCALLAVEPNAKQVVPTLASLYGRGAPRVRRDAHPPMPPAPPHGPLDETPGPLAPAELLGSILGLAAVVDEGPEPDALSPLPILSDLEEEDLARVLAEVTRKRLPDGAPLMRQGDPGDAFYLLAHGGVRVTRKDDGEERVLATLAPGAILGEIALVTRTPRSATVTAVGDIDVVRVPVRAIAKIAGDRRPVAEALDRFTRDRLLRTAITGSWIFRPFLPERLAEILPRFESRDYDEGTDLLLEGQPGLGLFLVVAGECQVTRVEDDFEMEIGRVGPGEIVGEASFLGEGRAGATVTAVRPSIALFMPRAAFDDLVSDEPEAREELERLGVTHDVVNASVLDEDGFLDPELLVEEDDDQLLR